MRASMAAATVAGLAVLGVVVTLVGRSVAPDSIPVFDPADAEATRSDEPAPDQARQQTEPGISGEAGQEPDGEGADTPSGTLTREEPREPLSALGQALPPPKPEVSLLYRPVATASATFEAMGYSFAIAGTESIDPDETCNAGGTDWPCGVRARAAVRAWLRGRALSCKLPDDTSGEITIGCSLGKQDVGDWLVSNGWARAAPGGPYEEAEAKAREARMGIFGPPPTATN